VLDRNAQIELLLEHNNHPCCRERLLDADVAMPGGNPGCGDVVTIYLKAGRPAGTTEGEPERVERASFLGSGCTISQAAASMLMELVQEERPTLDEVLAMSYEDMMDMLGREVVSSRPRCATLALGTLKAAVRKHQRDQQRRAAGLPVEDISPEEMEPFESH
jgi:nitrogen fixation protein NifU and related proteins